MVSIFLKKYWYLFIISFFIVNIILYPSSIDVLEKLQALNIVGYTDQQKGGGSIISVDTSKLVSYKYMRKPHEIVYPYAGVTISKKGGVFFEVDNYKLHLEANLKGSNTVNVRLQVFADDFSDIQDSNTFVFCQKIISGKNGYVDVEIDLNDLEVPTWWVKSKGISTEQIPEFNFDQTALIVFDHDPSLELNKEASVEILSLEFLPDRSLYFVVNLFVIICSSLLYVYILIARKRRIVVSAPYKINEKNDQKPIDKETLLINYLAENYTRGELTLSKVSNELGIASQDVSKIIKSKFDLTYNQYLNFLRIEEAKRLLIHTDLQVKEIVYDTGYESLQHFSRVFKASLGVTPTHFRSEKNNTKSN